MEKQINKLGNSRVEVLVKVDEKTWKAAQKKAFEKAASNVSIDGFRKGKAPEHLVKSRINQAEVLEQAVNEVLPKAFREILDEGEVKPVAQPKVDVTKISDTDLEIKFMIVTEPEVELGKYKGLKVEKPEVEVTEEDLKKALEAVTKENATLVVKEGVAKKGDTVVMDFKGTVDGNEFEGGSAENYELELGSNSFIPGFEDQLVGAKAGAHVDVKVKFPENYTPELKGKDAVFACDVHEVKEKKIPALNDELVAELNLPEVKTVSQFEEYKRKELLAEKERQANNDFMVALINKILETSKVNVPDELLDEQVESRKQDIVNRMSQSGLTLEQYLSLVGQSEEQFTEQVKADATREVTNYFLINKIAEVEDLKVTPEELEFEMSKLAEQYNMTIDDVKKALEKQMGAFADNLKMKKVEDFLKENN